MRKIAYSVAGSDNLTLSVNGVPVIVKGGDWGIDEAMKRIPRRRLETAVRLHQFANYTLIRNWVGQSTSAALYDLCDEYGDPALGRVFSNRIPPTARSPRTWSSTSPNVRDKILRFRSHPCIALWCARNEGDPPPAIGQGIQKLINELDPGRLYQPSFHLRSGRELRRALPLAHSA